MQSGETRVQKTYVYILLFSFVVSLVGMAMFKWGGSDQEQRPPVTAAQKLKMLATIKPESSQIAGFLHSATENQEASREVNGN
jgi:hypothetical protein